MPLHDELRDADGDGDAPGAAIAVWRIDRPDAKNALDVATFAALADAIDAARRNPRVRAAVLTGEGDVFVAGGDLRELRDKNTRADAERLSDVGFALCRAIAELPFPVIAALNGPAIGGGAELAVACDSRVADRAATICFKQVRLGVTTAWGTVPRLVALVGAGAAARILYGAPVVSAEDALAVGLVDGIAEPGGGAFAMALARATEVAKGSPSAVCAMKRLVRASTEPGADVRALERELFVETWSASDHALAIEAYFARRAVRWGERP